VFIVGVCIVLVMEKIVSLEANKNKKWQRNGRCSLVASLQTRNRPPLLIFYWIRCFCLFFCWWLFFILNFIFVIMILHVLSLTMQQILELVHMHPHLNVCADLILLTANLCLCTVVHALALKKIFSCSQRNLNFVCFGRIYCNQQATQRGEIYQINLCIIFQSLFFPINFFLQIKIIIRKSDTLIILKKY